MSKGRILLVIPPGAPGTTPNREGAGGLGAVEPTTGGFRYPPHTVAMLAGALSQTDYKVIALDAVALGYDLTYSVRQSLSQKADLIAVHVSWATRETDRSFLENLVAQRSSPMPVIALGVSTRHMLAHLEAADCILEGEPELALPKLCEALLAPDGNVPKRVEARDLAIACYDRGNLVTDLDALPMPAWRTLSLESYDALSVWGSRGCPQQCSWCPYVVAQGHAYRTRTPAHIVRELGEIVSLRPSRIIFRDPVFAYSRERVAEICERILQEPRLRPGKNLRWECESRPEHFDDRLLRLMSLAGCVAIKVGFETADAPLLTAHHRLLPGETGDEYVNQTSAVARACRRVGIACRLFVLVGLPGETEEAVQATAVAVKAIAPDTLTIKPVIAYPGTAFAGEPPLDEAETELCQRVLDDVKRAIERHSIRHRSMWYRVRRRLWNVAHRIH